jgi:uncharacterized damage-inducible protein DinB
MEHNLTEDIREIILRDLADMASEVEAVPEEHLWTAVPGIINPVGTLSHHLCGNLRHFVGAVLGNDGYARDRADEFDARDLTKNALLDEIQATIEAVNKALSSFDPARLSEPMPDTPPQHKGRTIGFFLVQLCCHLSRHRGQLNYLRRILAGGTNA